MRLEEENTKHIKEKREKDDKITKQLAYQTTLDAEIAELKNAVAKQYYENLELKNQVKPYPSL